MKRTVRRLTIALQVSFVSCALVWAQGGSAQISGTVKDTTGAVLPGVEITATQTDTGVARSTVTNETGFYVLPNLAVGPYRIEAALPGFRSYVQTGIVLQVNANPVVNPVLEVGQVTQQVEVQANAALVETRSSSVGAVVENQRILELPLNGRNTTELITLSGGAVQVGNSLPKTGSKALVQVAGGLTFALGYTLDGANHTNSESGAAWPLPFPDALQEFKVDISGVSIDQGKGGGVSAVMKSGTNNFHGDLFEFVRNDLFNARNYFAVKGSTLKRNQFGGTIGGPIKQNRLFFFAGYQGTTVRQDPADVETFLPTSAMLAGDWTAFASAACNAGRPLTLRAPFVNNRIDPAQYSKVGLGIVQRVLPKAPAPRNECGQVLFGRPNKSNEWVGLGKMDYQWSAKHSIFGRYQADSSDSPSAYDLTPDNILNASVTGIHNVFQTVAFGSTYLISPDLFNAFRATAHRSVTKTFGTETFTICDLGSKAYCGFDPKRTFISVTNGPTVGNSFSKNPPVTSSVAMFSINDDLTLVRGVHQMAFGINASAEKSVSTALTSAAGRLVINGSVTGHGLGDLLTGKLSQYVQAGPNYDGAMTPFFGMYATDVWKATPRVTVSYGLRWDPYIPQVSFGRGVASFDYERFKQGIRSTAYPEAPYGWYYPGDPGSPGWKASFIKWRNFSPRLGFAWDVTGNGRTSIRASYGYSYTSVLGLWRDDINDHNPWGNGTRMVNPAGGLDDPWRDFPGGNPFPDVYARHGFAQNGDYTSIPWDIQTPQTSSWNLSLERQIASDWLVSAAYIGNLTTHIWVQAPGNPAIFIPGGSCTLQGVTYTPCSQSSDTNVAARRRFTLERPNDPTKMGNVALTEDSGTMNYHGMLLTVQRRAARGLALGANYTWSHCIGDFADISSNGPDSGEVYTKFGDRRFDRGDCDGDRRHIFNFTSVAETPEFSNPTLHKLATGWRFSTIYRRSSGQPLNVLVGSDRALTGIASFYAGTLYQRGDQILANAYADTSGRPLTNWLNRSAFDIPALGTVGNFRRNSVVGPPSWAFDVALSRSFKFREIQRMEFRAEAFNLTNSFRPGNPNTTLSSGLFGQIRTALDPRVLQFALKYVF